MCGDGTYGQSAFHGGGAITNVMYGKSVIASEAKQSRENPGGAIKFEPPSWIASSLRSSQ